MFLINGLFTESISVQDRGLHYGDGVFETVALVEGNPLCWDAHYQRLQEGCRRLDLQCPSRELLDSDINLLPLTNPQCVVKIIVTRGAGGRGYRPPVPDAVPTRIVGLYPWPDIPRHYPVAGIKAMICATRLARNPLLAGIKHLNRLEQVLARSEWNDPDIAEGLMLDTGGALISGTMSNLFCIRNNVLQTPDLAACGIAGVIRSGILQLATQFNLTARVGTLVEADLYAADEVLLCNSIIGIWPVREIGTRTFPAGSKTHEIRQSIIRAGMIAA